MSLPLWDDKSISVTDASSAGAPEPLAVPAAAVRAEIVVEADGGSRGNPGVAAGGAIVLDPKTGELLAEVGVTGLLDDRVPVRRLRLRCADVA